ncbi:hypothetical protein J5F27_01885 [Schleiferilactobacillus harbinensis]|jgi:D-lactate dehydrogenase|uniref:NAD(P)-dependent oxidoreductase n=1 Tax=Schleiferilactobacillus harbinensis TaxID=304207 RepID=UPI00116F1226|nr:NAD(P)-dependent oxidoreductase [Schleiferilactobacillus harbinensis]MBO3090666.1 hypothetical protein [Schleiferilactobacillus harbinensis]MCI1686888.1 D-2-hydroxyacid dehydrogenase [Schleiferilactobacillus harbinensis]MCI1784248.1 D-2-hydroxyacid dehydrogenase [Schleiferilactobacillus harbinensis]MCI1850559.1 D-2-hydroxyacid dehydrogenase [Schleiferilactobacillus harbinensis]GEK05380.1 lactate dehydrogenase [Schleiferilactobacillus harbinensis]
MQFGIYGLKPEEKEFFDAWAAENSVTLQFHQEILGGQTPADFAGDDVVVALQTVAYPPAAIEAMAQAGVKYLALRNVGTDNVPFATLAANGIQLANVPAYSPQSIAEFAVSLTLQLVRNFGYVIQSISHHQYTDAMQRTGKELGTLTIGVVGTGRIGASAVKLFQGFGSQVIAYDPYPNPALKDQVEYVDDLADLWPRVDVVDLHIPGTKENTHLIGADQIAQMKDGVYLINTARGNLIDTQALIAGLTSGKIAGAGIDTFEFEADVYPAWEKNEAPANPLYEKLLADPRVIMTPHIAYHTETAVENMVTVSLNNAKAFVETGHAPHELDVAKLADA